MAEISEQIRLTKNNREKLLKKNEGFSKTTNYESRNFREFRKYTIENGSLIVETNGKTSWSDSHYNNKYIANDEEVHRFLYKNLWDLDTKID